MSFANAGGVAAAGAGRAGDVGGLRAMRGQQAAAGSVAACGLVSGTLGERDRGCGAGAGYACVNACEAGRSG